MFLSFNSNTTGAISEAGTTDPFGAPDHEFNNKSYFLFYKIIIMSLYTQFYYISVITSMKLTNLISR
jgi:hypothetical protein